MEQSWYQHFDDSEYRTLWILIYVCSDVFYIANQQIEKIVYQCHLYFITA